MWMTKLSQWQTALEAQDVADQGGPVTTFDSLNTRMICCERFYAHRTPLICLDHALGQYERGYELAQSLFEGLNDHERHKTAHWAVASAWHMVRLIRKGLALTG